MNSFNVIVAAVIVGGILLMVMSVVAGVLVFQAMANDWWRPKKPIQSSPNTEVAIMPYATRDGDRYRDPF